MRIELKAGFSQKMENRLEEMQKAVDNEILDRCAKYIPFRDGTLDRMGKMATKIGSGRIVYPGPYARFLYHGKVMIGERSNSPWAKKGERKILTNRDLTYNGAPVRGAKWFDRMMAAEKNAIIQTAAKAARRSMK